MVLVEKSLDEMMEEIKFTRLSYFDVWSPDEKPDRHEMRDASDLGWGWYIDTDYKYFSSVLDSSIPPGLGLEHGKGILTNGTMICAFENSLKWGHNLDPGLMISLKILVGGDGIIIRIRDSGKGFPWRDYIRMHNKGDLTYKQNGGNGFNEFGHDKFEISYEGNGSIINIMAHRRHFEAYKEMFGRYLS